MLLYRYLRARQMCATGGRGGGGPVGVSDGQWEEICKFGEAGDVGNAFDVVAFVLDEPKRCGVLRWFAESARSGRRDRMPLPRPLPETLIARICVGRTRGTML